MPSFEPCILEKGSSAQLKRTPRDCGFTLWLVDVCSAPVQYLRLRDLAAMAYRVLYLVIWRDGSHLIN